MAVTDLRSYIDALAAGGRLARVRREVSLEHELADVAAALERTAAGAGLFEQPTGSRWPIFSGAVSNRALAALALECAPGDVIDRMEYALEPSHGISTTRVEQAAWEQNTVRGDEVDLSMIPIPTHSRGDGGAFITGAVTVTKDPVSGRGNLSYNRMLRFDRNHLGFNLNEWRDVGTFMKSRPDPEAPFPVALAIGLDPAITIAAGVRTPIDELLIAGALRGSGIEVRQGLTSDIDIPAAAEVVIEGLIRPSLRRLEGPLAEFHGYHGEEWNSPTVEVTAISWRHDPIYQTIIPGWYEHVFIGNVLPREPLLRRFVRHLDPNADVHIPPYGNGFLAIVQIDRDNPGQPKNLAMAAMTAHINIRNVVVVDRDVDIDQPSEVLWAITNRVDWRDDIFIAPNAQGHEMDPVADQRGVSFKLGIDATYKRERREYGTRVAYGPVDLSTYLGIDAVTRRIIVGISGASGVAYGVRALELLREHDDVTTHLVMTPAAKVTLGTESDHSPADVEALADHVYGHRDIGAPIASGSFATAGMIVAPCSIKTLSAVANSYSADLLVRAADVTLKERRPLVLMVRETPLHLGHLRLCAQAAEVGAVIYPPVPAFYANPGSIDDLVTHSVVRALEHLGLDAAGITRWSGG